MIVIVVVEFDVIPQNLTRTLIEDDFAFAIAPFCFDPVAAQPGPFDGDPRITLRPQCIHKRIEPVLRKTGRYHDPTQDQAKKDRPEGHRSLLFHGRLPGYGKPNAVVCDMRSVVVRSLAAVITTVVTAGLSVAAIFTTVVISALVTMIAGRTVIVASIMVGTIVVAL